MKQQEIEEKIKINAEEFAKNAEDWGKKVEAKWNKKDHKIGERVINPSEFIVSIIINVILFFIWGNLPKWFLWITGSFAAVLPLFYFSFAATIVANIIFLVNPGRRFVAFGKLILNVFSIIVMISVYYIYPFDFSLVANYWGIITRIIILIAIFGTAIGTIVEFINLLTGRR